MSPNAAALVRTLLSDTIVLAVPGLFGLAVALWFRVSSRAIQAIYSLTSICLLAYIVGGCYLVSFSFGRIAGRTLFIVELVAAIAVCYLVRDRLLPTVRLFAVLTAMTVAAAGFSLGLGYLHGFTMHNAHMVLTLATPRFRFARGLPIDNWLPYKFATQVLTNQRPLPHKLTNGWLSSDRPPMQTAVYVLLRTLTPGGDTSALRYEVTGTLLQSLWMPAMWCFLTAARLPRRAVTLGLGIVLVSGFAILNSFYVWPKLFPAAFVVLIVAVVFTDEWQQHRTSAVVGLALGLAAAMAMLGHEGSALALIPLGVIIVARRGLRPGFWCALTGIVVLIALMVPWTLYQTKYDPPGDNLTKLQFAGQNHRNSNQSLVNAITSSYGKLSDGQIAYNKATNLGTPFTHENEEISSVVTLASNLFATGGASARHRDSAVINIRSVSFFYILPTMGFMALGPIALLVVVLLRRRLDHALKVALRVWAWFGLALGFWALVLFSSDSTLIHQGSYAMELLAFGASFIGLWKLSPRFAAAIGALQAILGVAVYAAFEPSWSTLRELGPPVVPIEATICVLGLIIALGLGHVASLVSDSVEHDPHSHEALVQ